ncbi:Nucleotide sugar synthetase-like protein [Streptococcus sp. DD13]|nr:Nucleotide sugar synthetase-like protein [Streptococcus sp. DD13]
MAQNDVMKIVRGMGANELALYFYHNENEPWPEKNARFDGIIAGFGYGDVVFFQSPSWNGHEWDTHVVNKVKSLQARVVMFIHDVPPLMFESNYYLMPAYIELYNKSDVVVVPSERMRDKLIAEGLTVQKIIIQKMWDFTHDLQLHQPTFQRKLIFSGDPSRFPHILDWKQEVPLHVYTEEKEGIDYSKVHLEGWRNKQELLLDLSKGGFGLVWGNSENPQDEREYYKMNISYKLSAYLAAGIPVVVPDYLSNADYIRERGIGFVVSSLEEASQVVAVCTPEQYQQMAERARYVSYLISNGYFTKKLTVDAIMALS